MEIVHVADITETYWVNKYTLKWRCLDLNYIEKTVRFRFFCVLYLRIRKNGALGSRLTGAGWGGCVVSLVPADKLQTFISSLSAGYYSEPSRAPLVSDCLFATQPGDGAALFVFWCLRNGPLWINHFPRLLCFRPSRLHYRSCPFVLYRSICPSQQASNLKTKRIMKNKNGMIVNHNRNNWYVIFFRSKGHRSVGWSHIICRHKIVLLLICFVVQLLLVHIETLNLLMLVSFMISYVVYHYHLI